MQSRYQHIGKRPTHLIVAWDEIVDAHGNFNVEPMLTHSGADIEATFHGLLDEGLSTGAAQLATIKKYWPKAYAVMMRQVDGLVLKIPTPFIESTIYNEALPAVHVFMVGGFEYIRLDLNLPGLHLHG